MNHEFDPINEAFHKTRRTDHEQTMADLDKSYPGKPGATREQRLDRADIAYSELYEKGGLEGPFELPSERSARLHREAVKEDRPPEIYTFSWRDSEFSWSLNTFYDEESRERARIANDPKSALIEEPDGTYAIKESFRDNDFLDGSSRITWLRCGSAEDARRYVRQVGEYHEEPGPGWDDGKYYKRDIYKKESADNVVLIPLREE
jgi:hypothetical protein